MKKYPLLSPLEEWHRETVTGWLLRRNISSLPRLSVLTVDNRDVSHSEMRGNSIRESVMLQEMISYLFTLLINPILCIIRTIGGVMRGIL